MMKQLSQFLLAGIALAVMVGTASADTLTWSGGNGTWQDGTVGNFDGTWSNANPDSATFGTAAGTVTLGGNINLENLTISPAHSRRLRLFHR